MPALPAAIETAAFRIATEATMNSARRSGTDQAWVQIEHRDGCLEVSVRDAGSAVNSWVPGVGLSSMRERAAEVGGKVQVTTDHEGSLVRALLPLP
jgi:signal transduction histidine kinase